MSLVIAPGYSHASGGLVTPSRLNTAISGLSISMAAKKLLGTTGAGVAGEIAYTDDGLAMLQAADVAAQLALLDLDGITAAGYALIEAADLVAQKTILGIGAGTAIESDVTASKGVSKTTSVAGSSTADVVFDTANAPSVSLTAGTWVVTGSVGVALGYFTQYTYLTLQNVTDSAEFGASGTAVGVHRAPIAVSGKITVASGTKVIKFRCHSTNISGGTDSLVLGCSDATIPAGYIVAHKLIG